MNRKGRRRLVVAMMATALAMGFAACGGDEDDSGETTPAAGPTEITVTADEYSFELSSEPQAGDTSFLLVNEGEEPHAMLVARINEGFTLEEAFEAEGGKGTADTLGDAFARPGAEAERPVETELTPGDYALICPVETGGKSHFELGQQVEFTIE